MAATRVCRSASDLVFRDAAQHGQGEARARRQGEQHAVGRRSAPASGAPIRRWAGWRRRPVCALPRSRQCGSAIRASRTLRAPSRLPAGACGVRRAEFQRRCGPQSFAKTARMRARDGIHRAANFEARRRRRARGSQVSAKRGSCSMKACTSTLPQATPTNDAAPQNGAPHQSPVEFRFLRIGRLRHRLSNPPEFFRPAATRFPRPG